jgi:prepilin-type N-terminal cleavage/methylation domain-containing protein
MPRLTSARPFRAGGRRRSGVTLVELLVVLTILGIVGAALVRTFSKQQQVYKDSANTATMRRELRLGGMMLPQDVRSISSAGGDVLEMTEQRFAFLGTYGSAVICDRTANTFDVMPTNLARHTMTTWISRPTPGDTVFAYNDSLLAGAEDDAWQKLSITAFDQNTTTCPGAPFADPALDPPGTKPRFRTTIVSSTGGNIADSVRVGAVARFTRPMRYELLQSSGSGAWYLNYSEYTNGAWTSPTPISGPYRPFVAGDGNPSGLQFRYFDSTGTRLTGIAQKLRLSRLDVFLRAEGGTSAVTERKGALMTDSTIFRIALRNFK